VSTQVDRGTEGARIARASEPSSLELRNVTKLYGEGPLATPVVYDCSFTLEAGKLTAMIGPSGCGKSTIAFLVAGFERPTRGEVLLDGTAVSQPSHDRLLIFQETALMPWLTTYENIMFGPKMRRAANKETKRRANELLERVGLREFRDKYPLQLSGGMQRRAELARALVNDPKIMVLDEPFRGLDAMTRILMQEYYSALFEEGGQTSLFITTDIDEAIFLADRLLIMANIPTRVREVIDVDLPRPRDKEEVLVSERANEIKEQAFDLLHEEALKSFAGGNKAAADFVEAYTRRQETTDE
jgi:NitT/TauT family transport system ATP-binding protein